MVKDDIQLFKTRSSMALERNELDSSVADRRSIFTGKRQDTVGTIVIFDNRPGAGSQSEAEAK